MRVVLTAAIMDVLHRGHKNLLEQLRDAGDYVIVILHDDLSCYRIKDKIPIQTVRHRKRNVLLTGLVDRVLITKHTDPADRIEEVIKEFGAEKVVFIRGDDNPQFPGRWMVEKHKVAIQLVPYTEGVSSSDIRESL